MNAPLSEILKKVDDTLPNAQADITRGEVIDLTKRIANLEQAVEHAKDEYYHKGRRDLIFEMASTADEWDAEDLEEVKKQEVDRYRRHTRSRKAEAH